MERYGKNSMKYVSVVTVVGKIFRTVMMHRVIMVFSKEIETIKYFSDFFNNFPEVFPKIDKKMSKNLHQNKKKFVRRIRHDSSHFLHNFIKISKKHFRYFFIISIISIM